MQILGADLAKVTCECSDRKKMISCVSIYGSESYALLAAFLKKVLV